MATTNQSFTIKPSFQQSNPFAQESPVNKFGQPFTSLNGDVSPQNNFGQPFASLTGAQTPPNAFGTPFTGMKRGVPGSSYMSQDRFNERQGRIYDRQQRRGLANFEMGGGGRGSSGGGSRPLPAIPSSVASRYISGPVQQPMPVPQFQGMLSGPSPLADSVALNYGNAPSLGMDRALALARTQNGVANAGDFSTIRQGASPRLGVEYNRAAARKDFRQYLSMQNPNGLVGAAQSALYS